MVAVDCFWSSGRNKAMVDRQRVLVIGDGLGGLSFANKLKLKSTNAEIKVVGKSPKHYYKADGLQIPFQLKNYRQSVKNVRFLLHDSIEYLRDEVIRINPRQKTVNLGSGRTDYYDYLVIATGARLATEEIPGYDGEAKHFYDLQHSMELELIIKKFNDGNLVITVPDTAYQCPPAPYQFAILADEYFSKRNLRGRISITFLSPYKTLFPLAAVSERIESIFEDHNVTFKTGFKTVSVNQKNKEVLSETGDHENYGLLVMIPPHRGQSFISDSGLPGEHGFVNVDPSTLQVKDAPGVFAIGDAAHLETVKAGSATLHQAETVSDIISNELGSDYPVRPYDGSATCLLFAGDKTGARLSTSYAGGTTMSNPDRLGFYLKKIDSDLYFSSLIRGMS